MVWTWDRGYVVGMELVSRTLFATQHLIIVPPPCSAKRVGLMSSIPTGAPIPRPYSPLSTASTRTCRNSAGFLKNFRSSCCDTRVCGRCKCHRATELHVPQCHRDTRVCGATLVFVDVVIMEKKTQTIASGNSLPPSLGPRAFRPKVATPNLI